MTIIAGCLLVALVVQQIAYQRTIRGLLAAQIAERAKLLDRIQHPQVLQASALPEDYETPEPPKDAAELAYVGEEVPGFVQVGSQE